MAGKARQLGCHLQGPPPKPASPAGDMNLCWRYISCLSHHRKVFMDNVRSLSSMSPSWSVLVLCQVHSLVRILPNVNFVLLALTFPTLSPCRQSRPHPLMPVSTYLLPSLVYLMHYKKSDINFHTGFFYFIKFIKDQQCWSLFDCFF